MGGDALLPSQAALNGYEITPNSAERARASATGAVAMMPNQAFDVGLAAAGFRSFSLARPVTFYRGTGFECVIARQLMSRDWPQDKLGLRHFHDFEMTTFSKNMNQHDNFVLARVNPELIVIDRRYLKPTNWDINA